MADKVVTTDVLVLGGGLAGCMAAIRAREQGARVTVVDKAAIQRSGDAGRGFFFYNSYFNSGDPTDTAEAYRKWWGDVRYGLVDMKVVDALVINPQPLVQQYLEKMGVPLKDAVTGRVRKDPRMYDQGDDVVRGNIEFHRVFFQGENIKTILGKRVEELGAQVIERVQVTRLLTDNGRVIGATGFHNRDGDFYTFKAKTVVLAMGSAMRVFPTPNDNPFNTYRRPWHGGTGYALALRAGAELASMEFITANLGCRWVPRAVASPLRAAGAPLVNALGEPIEERPDRPGEFGIGWGIQYAAVRELMAGRGPIYFDTRKLTREQVQEAIKEQARHDLWDAPMSVEYLERTGVDLAGGLVECTPYLGAGNCSGSPKGTLVDEKGESTVQGLFPAGDLSNASDAASGALTSGFVAGFEAAKLAKTLEQGEPDEMQVKEEKERVFVPLHRKGSMKWDDLEKELRQAMVKHVGIFRTEVGLKSALNQLRTLEATELSADNLHELMRAHETMDTLTFEQIMATAALERTESRCGPAMSHYRGDYPKPDDERWWGVATVVKKDNGKITSSRRRMNQREK